MTALTIAGLTLREAVPPAGAAGRSLVLTVVLLALSAWGFSQLVGLDTELGTLTSGEARLVASMVLNLVMFGISLIAALGTAFLAGPTLAGEIESGRRWRCWPGRSAARPCCSASGWGWSPSAAASSSSPGSAQFLVVRATVGYWPPHPVARPRAARRRRRSCC